MQLSMEGALRPGSCLRQTLGITATLTPQLPDHRIAAP